MGVHPTSPGDSTSVLRRYTEPSLGAVWNVVIRAGCSTQRGLYHISTVWHSYARTLCDLCLIATEIYNLPSVLSNVVLKSSFCLFLSPCSEDRSCPESLSNSDDWVLSQGDLISVSEQTPTPPTHFLFYDFLMAYDTRL